MGIHVSDSPHSKEKRRKIITATFKKGSTVEDIKKIIKSYQHSPCHTRTKPPIYS